MEKFGLSAIEEAHVVRAILGVADDIGRWVGCDGRRLMPKRRYNLWATSLNVTEGLITVRVKLFAWADGTEYIVIVGRLNDVMRGFLQSVGYNGS